MDHLALGAAVLASVIGTALRFTDAESFARLLTNAQPLSLQAVDIGISVDNAAEVAKQAADFVLLEPNLDVLCEGIEEGRHTFANTLKYISIVSSAKFGTMISMAPALLVLPFLPLLAK